MFRIILVCPTDSLPTNNRQSTDIPAIVHRHTADSSPICFAEEFSSHLFEEFCPHRNTIVYSNKYVMTARVFQVNDVLIMTPIWWHCVKLIRTRTGLSNHTLNIYTSNGWAISNSLPGLLYIFPLLFVQRNYYIVVMKRKLYPCIFTIQQLHFEM